MPDWSGLYIADKCLQGTKGLLWIKPLSQAGDPLRRLLVKGLGISRDVLLTDMVVMRKLRAFLEDELDNMFPPWEVAHMIAPPSRVDVSRGGERWGRWRI
jgi:hypothetical protein